MTSHGSPYARFQRALRIGRLSMVRAAAAELPRIDLDDALAICLLIERQDGERYERAVVRWLARLAMEVPAVGIDDLREGLVAFEALPYNPVAAARRWRRCATATGCARAAERLRRGREGHLGFSPWDSAISPSIWARPTRSCSNAGAASSCRSRPWWPSTPSAATSTRSAPRRTG